MDIGKLSLAAGLFLSALSVVLYVVSLKGSKGILIAARLCFGASALMSIAAFTRLMMLIVGHQFQYSYVWEYSSRNLSSPFIYAATWAGQQGSFLLWAVWTAIIGLLLIWKAGKWENRIMPIYATVMVFLFGILVWFSPFELIIRGSGATNWPANLPWPPPDGLGLNPSLQNYWMAIHPPTIFFGFASLAVPFAYAIAAMIWKEYESWSQRVMPYVLLTIATLGVGLFMGGYWAYETQGWHGFWAWDPVENASLFPWLGALALSHGLIVQRNRGGMGKTNLFLAIASWLLFIYGTYLTRSGVLASFSVHAFGMLDNKALQLLPAMLALYGIGGLGLLIYRWQSIPGKPVAEKFLSRDTAMALCVSLFIITALIVAVGTSWPLISQWGVLRNTALFSAKGSAVKPIFYNQVGAILLVPGLLVMGIVPFLLWGKTESEKFLWKVMFPWFAAIGVGFGIVWFVRAQNVGDFHPSTPPVLVVILGTLAAFAVFANVIVAVRLIIKSPVAIGGWLAHIGIGLLIIGTVLSNVYEKTEMRVVIEGESPIPTSFGYSLQYAGWTHDDIRGEPISAQWERFDHAVKLKLIPTGATGSTEDAQIGKVAVFKYWQQDSTMPEGGKMATMTWPYIHREPLRDFYLSAADEPKLLRVGATLRPGESSSIGDGLRMTGYTVKYKKFYREGEPGSSSTVMGAEMELKAPDGKTYPMRPGMRIGGPSGPVAVNEDIPGLHGAVLMQGAVDAATHQITVVFELPDAAAIWTVPVAVTNKPMINLVWLGVALMGLGTIISMARRAIEARPVKLVIEPVSIKKPVKLK